MPQAPAEIAAEVVRLAREGGWTIMVNGDTVKIVQSFTPGDRQAYVALDGDAYWVLAPIPQVSPGSVWGTTSDGVGGIAAIDSGVYRLNKSGCSKRVCKEIEKLIGTTASRRTAVDSDYRAGVEQGRKDALEGKPPRPYVEGIGAAYGPWVDGYNAGYDAAWQQSVQSSRRTAQVRTWFKGDEAAQADTFGGEYRLPYYEEAPPGWYTYGESEAVFTGPFASEAEAQANIADEGNQAWGDLKDVYVVKKGSRRKATLLEEKGRQADASVIMSQLGMARLAVGLRDVVDLGDGIMGTIGRSKLTKLVIKLNGRDLYDVGLIRTKRGTLDTTDEVVVRDVYAEDLASVVRNRIEPKLAVRRTGVALGDEVEFDFGGGWWSGAPERGSTLRGKVVEVRGRSVVVDADTGYPGGSQSLVPLDQVRVVATRSTAQDFGDFGGGLDEASTQTATCVNCGREIRRSNGLNNRAWRHEGGSIMCLNGESVAEPGRVTGHRRQAFNPSPEFWGDALPSSDVMGGPFATRAEAEDLLATTTTGHPDAVVVERGGQWYIVTDPVLLTAHRRQAGGEDRWREPWSGQSGVQGPDACATCHGKGDVELNGAPLDRMSGPLAEIKVCPSCDGTGKKLASLRVSTPAGEAVIDLGRDLPFMEARERVITAALARGWADHRDQVRVTREASSLDQDWRRELAHTYLHLTGEHLDVIGRFHLVEKARAAGMGVPEAARQLASYLLHRDFSVMDALQAHDKAIQFIESRASLTSSNQQWSHTTSATRTTNGLFTVWADDNAPDGEKPENGAKGDDCPKCDGKGTVPDGEGGVDDCETCGGTGKAPTADDGDVEGGRVKADA